MTEDSHVPNHDIFLDPCNSSSPPPNMVDDMDLLIALRKGARSCVKYPIANSVPYNVSSPSTHSFFIALSSISTSNSMSKALSQSKWKGAMEKRYGL